MMERRRGPPLVAVKLGISHRRRGLVRAVLLGLSLLECACEPPSPRDPSREEQRPDWNDGEVAWRAYAAGIAEAKATRTPVVLIFYTDWCPHCHNYSRVFHDPEVVKAAGDFVMIRVNRDENPELSEAYDLDGQYVPRTFFLRPDGEVREEFTGQNPQYRYYLDEHNPSELLVLMDRALGEPRAGSSRAPD